MPFELINNTSRTYVFIINGSHFFLFLNPVINDFTNEFDVILAIGKVKIKKQEN